MDKAKLTEWIWRQLAITLPADWECLQFARDPAVGRCAFADRHRYRLEFNWRSFKAEPDFDRMMKDYANSLESEWADIKPIRCRGLPGLVGHRRGEAVSRYGAYFDELKVLVELVFIHPEKRDDALEARILPTLRAVLPDADGYQQWRAFGMDLRVPENFNLQECVIEPGRVGLRFDGPKPPDRWIFRRYGFTDQWMNMPLRDWLAAQTEEDFVREPRNETFTRGNEHIERISGRWQPKGLLLKRGQFSSAAWRNETDRRLYQAICISGKRSSKQHPARGADEMLKACPEFTVVPDRPSF